MNIISKSSLDLFSTLPLLNRLGMEIKLDVCVIEVDESVTAIVMAGEGFHHSIVSKNNEQIAFQLKQKLVQNNMSFSLLEYSISHHRDKTQTSEWWQWRYNWVGNTPLRGERHVLSTVKTKNITALLEQQAEIKQAEIKQAC